MSLDHQPAVQVTSRIRTLIDLSGVLRLEALVAIGDHLVHQPRPEYEGRSVPYARLEELLEAAVAQVRRDSDSPAETTLRLALEHREAVDRVRDALLRQGWTVSA